MIPPTLPEITSSNWRELHEQGWRFVRNLPVFRYKRETIIKQLQEEYGVSRVTLGEPWNDELHGPAREQNMIKQAVYVRDVDTLVQAVREDLERFEQTGEW